MTLTLARGCRLSGAVSFWRPGAQDWAPAQVNTPLAPGDELYTGDQGDLELQASTRAFVRAWGDTQLGLANQEPDFVQFKVTSGHVSLDLRSLAPGRTVELDTPHAPFTIEHPGYYRADVTQERTSFITRRAGRAYYACPWRLSRRCLTLCSPDKKHHERRGWPRRPWVSPETLDRLRD